MLGENPIRKKKPYMNNNGKTIFPHPHQVLGTRWSLFNEVKELKMMNEVLSKLINNKKRELLRLRMILYFSMILNVTIIYFLIQKFL
jgi:hypothetical protein